MVDPRHEVVRERGSAAPWRAILAKELYNLWVGGRLLPLLLLFTILMSVTAVLRELESQVSLIPPAEMVFLTVLSTISFGMLIGVVIGADTISGERERATLEPLLLTPTSGRQIVLGKFLAALSPWPVAFALSLPYVLVLARGHEILGAALLWTALLGTLLAVAFTGFAMLVSIWSRSNRTSLFVSLFAYLLFLIPTQFPGQAQKGALGYAFQQVDPMQASSEFLEKFIVNNRAPQERFSYLVSDFISAIVIVAILFLYAAPRLGLDGASIRRSGTRKRAVAVAAPLVGAALVLGSLLMTAPAALGATAEPSQLAQAGVRMQVAATPLTISIDLEYATVKSGDQIEFTTVLTNIAAAPSPGVLVAMNIINLGKGDPVDPEDWSPERTQRVDPIDPGETAEQSWTVEAIIDGNYMVYMTVIADPGGRDATSLPIASPGIHLTVTPYQSKNPGGVLPIAVGIPLALTALTLLLRRYWRRNRARMTETEPPS